MGHYRVHADSHSSGTFVIAPQLLERTHPAPQTDDFCQVFYSITTGDKYFGDFATGLNPRDNPDVRYCGRPNVGWSGYRRSCLECASYDGRTVFSWHADGPEGPMVCAATATIDGLFVECECPLGHPAICHQRGWVPSNGRIQHQAGYEMGHGVKMVYWYDKADDE